MSLRARAVLPLCFAVVAACGGEARTSAGVPTSEDRPDAASVGRADSGHEGGSAADAASPPIPEIPSHCLPSCVARIFEICVAPPSHATCLVDVTTDGGAGSTTVCNPETGWRQSVNMTDGESGNHASVGPGIEPCLSVGWGGRALPGFAVYAAETTSILNLNGGSGACQDPGEPLVVQPLAPDSPDCAPWQAARFPVPLPDIGCASYEPGSCALDPP